MKSLSLQTLSCLVFLLGSAWAQDPPSEGEDTSGAGGENRAGELMDTARDVTSGAAERAGDVARQLADGANELNEREDVQSASTTVLEWIQSAESLYRPWMNWALVAVGIGLFISHAGQLILGKLWTLVRGKGFNLGECLNDFLVASFTGLSLPVVLLIPTGRGAFISNPLAVLSAAAVGMILGIFLYTHGMKQELLAAQERVDRRTEDEG